MELLFDIPEDVMLRQEKWGTQSQELPALSGTQAHGLSAGSAAPPALTALNCRACSTLSPNQSPDCCGSWDGPVGQADPERQSPKRGKKRKVRKAPDERNMVQPGQS